MVDETRSRDELRTDAGHAPRETRTRRLSTYLAVCGVFVLACLASNPLLHFFQSQSGLPKSARTEQAFLEDPEGDDHGIVPGAQVEFIIEPGSAAPVPWTAHDDGALLASGTVYGGAGERAASISTEGLAAGSWITIDVAGIAAPLREWVR